MAQSFDTEDDAGPPPSDGLTLVGETKRFLQRWQRLMLSADAWDAQQLTALRQQSRELEARAKAADMSGLAHHLQSCEHCFWNGEIDRTKLAHCLRNVSEVAWQWRHDLRRRSELPSHDGSAEVLEEQLTIEPPTLLAPPSIELFESSPPPAPEAEAPASEWVEPALGAWRQPPAPSFLSRVWRVGRGPSRSSAADASVADASVTHASRADAPAVPSFGDDAVGLGTSAALENGVHEGASGAEPASLDASSASAILSRRERGKPWWSASLGVLGIVGVGAVIWVLGGAGDQLSVSAAPARDGAGAASRGGQAAPRLPREAIDRMLRAAHGLGGLESPELADWLDAEAEELARTGGACAPGTPGCPLVSTARGLSVAEPAAGGGNGARVSWLQGLEPPGIGVDDEPLTRQAFEHYTRDAVGREALQELLFRCAPYRQQILASLGRYGLPSDLLALPMAASGCVADAESVEGVRGLWQLSPAAAKAYHLRVRAQQVDERLDPAKSTEAAVRLSEDLYRKLGSWELAIAAQRLGPLALLARLHDAGEDVDYESLVKTGMLPDDTVKYVRRVQALALVITNVDKFRFQPVSTRTAEDTAPLAVPSGTRLGLVARAAASSTTKIRELNPDVLGDRVPDWPGEKFVLRVPKDTEPRARELLPELIASSDHADECVPHAFDWGRQRFTTAMASRCEHATAASR